MKLYRFHHHHHIKNLFHSDFWLLELSVWLFTFARSMIGIFIPILLLQIGYSVGEVILFYFLYNLIDTPLNFFADWCVRRIGAKHAMIFATSMQIAFFLILYQLVPGNWHMLILLAITAALYDVFYWLAHLYLFIETHHKNQSANKDTSILYRIKKFASLLAPALGAVLLIFGGQKALIIVAIAIFALSLVPLAYLRHVHNTPTRKTPVSPKEFFQNPQERKNFLSLFLFGVHSETESTLWPIFIFLTIGTIESVAAVPIIVSLSAILFLSFLGRTKNKDREKLIIIGSGLVASIWIIRLLVPSVPLFYMSIFFVGLFELLISMPLESSLVERAKVVDSLAITTYRNTAFMLVHVFLYGALLVLVNVFHISFVLAIMSLLTLLMINYIFMRYKKIAI